MEKGEEEADVDQMTTDEFPERTFLKMSLKPGITPLNILGMWALDFVVVMILYLRVSCITYILVEDYNVLQVNAGKTAGRLGLYGALIVLPTELMLGVLSDLIGRKWLILIGLTMCSLALVSMTYGTEVYPTLLLFYLALALGGAPGYITPLLNDNI